MKRTILMNDVIVEKKVMVLDTTNLDNIHDVIVVNELVIKEAVDLVKYLSIDVDAYDHKDIEDLTNYVCMSFKYDYDTNIDDVHVDDDIIEQIKEYIEDYYS